MCIILSIIYLSVHLSAYPSVCSGSQATQVGLEFLTLLPPPPTSLGLGLQVFAIKPSTGLYLKQTSLAPE